MGRATKQTIEWAALREYDPRQALPRNPRMAVGHSPPHSAKPSAPPARVIPLTRAMATAGGVCATHGPHNTNSAFWILNAKRETHVYPLALGRLCCVR